MMIRVSMLETIHRWDVFTFCRIASMRLHRPLVRLARIVSRTADGWAYPLVPLVVWLSGSELATAFLLACLMAFGIERGIYLVAKNAFKRRRPAHVVPGYQSHVIASDEFSFPSGHTSAAFLMTSLLVLFFGPLFAVFYIWSTLVGASRVILGVHFPTDTAMGSLLGSSIAFSVFSWSNIA